MTIKFTPNSGADETVKTDGIDLQWSLLTTNSGTGNVTWVYENINIFFVKTDAVTLAKGDATKQDGSFIWTIEASDLVPYIAFYNTEYSDSVNKVSTIDTENPGNSVYNDSNLYLNTVAKYDAFKLALHSGTMGITVAEKTA